MSKLKNSKTNIQKTGRGNDTMRIIKLTTLKDYEWELKEQEKASGTIEKYLRDICHFYKWLGEDKQAIQL